MLKILKIITLCIFIFVFSYSNLFANNIETKYINLYNNLYKKIEYIYKYDNKKILKVLVKIEDKLTDIKKDKKYNEINKFKLIINTIYSINEEKILEIKTFNKNNSGNTSIQLLNSSKGLLSKGSKLHSNMYKLDKNLLLIINSIYNEGKTFNNTINSKIEIILKKYKNNIVLQQDLIKSEIKKRNCIENKYSIQNYSNTSTTNSEDTSNTPKTTYTTNSEDTSNTPETTSTTNSEDTSNIPSSNYR